MKCEMGGRRKKRKKKKKSAQDDPCWRGAKHGLARQFPTFCGKLKKLIDARFVLQNPDVMPTSEASKDSSHQKILREDNGAFSVG